MKYTIINIEVLEKRIEEWENTDTADWEGQLGKIEALKYVLSNTIPLDKELEKAANDFADKFLDEKDEDSPFQAQAALLGFEQGVKWAQERMYSQEECYRVLHNLMTDIKLQGLTINDDIDLKKWFEKHKKE